MKTILSFLSLQHNTALNFSFTNKLTAALCTLEISSANLYLFKLSYLKEKVLLDLRFLEEICLYISGWRVKQTASMSQ